MMPARSYHYKGFTIAITGEMIGPYVGSAVAWFSWSDVPVALSMAEAPDLQGAYDALVAEVEQYYRDHPVPAEA
jgi:hypothetical protein